MRGVTVPVTSYIHSFCNFAKTMKNDVIKYAIIADVLICSSLVAYKRSFKLLIYLVQLQFNYLPVAPNAHTHMYKNKRFSQYLSVSVTQTKFPGHSSGKKTWQNHSHSLLPCPVGRDLACHYLGIWRTLCTRPSEKNHLNRDRESMQLSK